jgi:hypothetical protein
MSPLETYLREMAEIRGPGVPETSFYPPFRNLLNAVGDTLKPKVRCIINLKNKGAGIPDGGLFTADLLKKNVNVEPLEGLPPDRGAIEVKPVSDDAWLVADSEQVSKYWAKYGHVLVTNYRDFVMVGRDARGKPVKLETYRLAESAAAFWSGAATPRKTADLHSERFLEYLKRVMLHAAPISAPEVIAWFLASYARDARIRIEQQPDLPALATVRTALEEALGLKFQDAKGEHFFRSTLVQTLFYGIFSAWVLWHREDPLRKDMFDWASASRYLRVPVLRKLFYQVADPNQLDELKLSEVLDWAVTVLNRVDRKSFFAAFTIGHEIQYFYEPFLEAFDPALRKELGVWYTPTEIVQYQVARVDTVLREELGIADGFADKRVYVLDPCCGTGAYLVEVLRHIAATLKDKHGDALCAAEVKKAATERVFGFEILPAPFVVAHLQIGLLLQNLGVPLSDKSRVAVYLTNGLTGWEPPKDPKQHLLFKEFEEERDAANHVKQSERILVILGNPPYNGFAGVAVGEERDLSNAYRTTKKVAPPQGQGLNELYVRFFRMAERRIVEMNQPAQGVVCFISNYSWLDGLSFTGMRERYLDAFDKIWIDNLHGDRIISEYSPDGRTSETIFAIEGNSPGIKIGTAISLLIKSGKGQAKILYRDMNQARAADRRAALLANVDGYEPLEPVLEIGLPFKPRAISKGFLNWPLLPDFFPVSFPAIQPCRDDVVVDIDRDRLVQRMEQYFNSKVSHEQMRQISPSAMTDTGTFKAVPAREQLLKRGLKPEFIVRYCYRPFDTRWLYWEPETNLLDRKREDYFPQVFEGNFWLGAAQRNRREFDPPLVSSLHCSRHIVERGANMFPIYLHTPTEHATLLEQAGRKPNLSDAAVAYLAALKATPEDLFCHTLAILHAPAYRTENAGALRQDWPRVPLPESKKALLASAELGRQVAALLDTEQPVPGVTEGKPRSELRSIAIPARIDGKQLDDAVDLDVTAGWGHAGKDGVTMPGKGRIEQHEKAYDVYLNDVAFWKNVPADVWDYTIGGYQVMKKWLSYREKTLLGRGLTLEEVQEVTNMGRRIAALLMLQPALDANYTAVKSATHQWQH